MNGQGPEIGSDGEGAALGPGSLLDQFQVIRLIGVGGMGRVYLARDTWLGRRVALKVLRPRRAPSSTDLKRFVDEARITARFNHPNIVTLYSAGVAQGLPYLAFEHVEGETLRRRMEAGRVGPGEAVRLGRTIALALSESHRSGVLHLDLKPSNVLLGKDRRLRVADFGVATLMERGEGVARPFVGTPGYMSPEQWLGERPTDRSDVFGLGVILFELLAGTSPFPGRDHDEVRAAVTSGAPAPALPVEAELSDLVAACLRRDPSERPSAEEVARVLAAMGARESLVPGAEESPFVGLGAFTERQAQRFFGRGGEVAAFVERLAAEPVLPIVGPSGAGKSSFVLAGVVPALREEGHWVVVALRPGSRPFEALAAALAAASGDGSASSGGGPGDDEPTVDLRAGAASTPPSPPPVDETPVDRRLLERPATLAALLGGLAARRRARVLLFVDQLEELFALVHDEVVRRRFMTALCSAADDAAGPCRVVFALRDAFLGHAAETAEGRAALSRVTVMRTPGPAGLRELLTEPVARVGYRYEDAGLVDEMIEAVRGEPAALPLLQVAGLRLWEGRDAGRRVLTRADYERIGGVQGALAQHADQSLEGLSIEERRAARDLLLRLVTPEGTRRALGRRVLLDGLGRAGGLVADRLVDFRVVAVRSTAEGEESELELVHESLITRWRQLARWIEEGREEHAFLSQVGQAAELWIRRGRRADEVWAGETLREARARASRCPHLPEPVAQFLEAGWRLERGRARRRRALLGASVAALAVAAAAMFVQWRQAVAGRTEALERRAEAEGRQAEALRQGARAALAGSRMVEARARLRASMEIADSPLSRALFWRLRADPLRWVAALAAPPGGADVAPGGESVAVTAGDWVYLFDAVTGERRILRGHHDMVYGVAFSPDGRSLASSTWAGEVAVWDLADGTMRALGRHGGMARRVAWSPDGRALASVGRDRSLKVWRLPDGAEALSVDDVDSPLEAVAFGAAGSLVAAGGQDGAVRVFDAATGRLRATLRGHRGGITDLAFSPDGRRLAACSNESPPRLWDAETFEGEELALGDRAVGVRSVAFSPRGRLLALAGVDGVVWLWDLEGRRRARVLEEHDGPVVMARFGAGGRLLASASLDRTARLWDLDAPPGQAPAQRGASGMANSVALAPDGLTLASGREGEIEVRSVVTGRVERVLLGHEGIVSGLAYSPAGDLLASSSYDGTVRLWRPAEGRQVARLGGGGRAVHSVVFDAAGERLVAAGRDGAVRLWRGPDWRDGGSLRGETAAAMQVAVDSAGTRVAAGGEDGALRLWSLSEGGLEALHPLGLPCVWGVGFVRGGDRVVAGGCDGAVLLVDPVSGASSAIGRHEGRVHWLGVAPDGARVATPSADRTARIWDLDGRGSVLLSGHVGEVNAAAFSPDGRLVATASDDHTVRLWDSRTGAPVWRTVAVVGTSPEVLTHEGWLGLEGGALRALDPGESRWRRSLEAEALVAADAGAVLCVARRDGSLAIWDREADEVLRIVATRGVDRLEATPEGCMTLSAGAADFHAAAGGTSHLARQATAIAVHGSDLLVAADRQVLAFDALGTERGRYEVDLQVSAIARVSGLLAVGHEDGSVELRPLPGEAPGRPISLAEVPAAAVVRIVEGPAGVVVAAHGDGHLGLWSLEDGSRVYRTALHGPPRHLRLGRGWLVAASDLGDVTALDLSVFARERCDLLREIWRTVPFTWGPSGPEVADPPAAHPCAGERARGAD